MEIINKTINKLIGLFIKFKKESSTEKNNKNELLNSIKNIIDDLYPPAYVDQPLFAQMVEGGKRLYLLDQLMPYAADTLKTGYTQKQLDGCYENEKNIWSFFIQNNLLFISDPEIIRDYMSDAPNTLTLGEASPGFIGQFVGWQIVKKWMSMQKEKDNLKMLMETSPKKIFEEAMKPIHFAISLTGEATFYPYLPELIDEINKRRTGNQ